MTRSVTFSERPDVAALLAQAEAETGLHDFGDDQLRGPLAAFTGFVNSQEQLSADSRRADGVGDRFAAYRQRFGL